MLLRWLMKWTDFLPRLQLVPLQCFSLTSNRVSSISWRCDDFALTRSTLERQHLSWEWTLPCLSFSMPIEMVCLHGRQKTGNTDCSVLLLWAYINRSITYIKVLCSVKTCKYELTILFIQSSPFKNDDPTDSKELSPDLLSLSLLYLENKLAFFFVCEISAVVMTIYVFHKTQNYSFNSCHYSGKSELGKKSRLFLYWRMSGNIKIYCSPKVRN